MTKNQYTYYKQAVQAFLDENNVRVSGPAKDQAEPFCSGSPCECCKSPLGGYRETYSFVGVTEFTADICPYCVYYLAYGRLDDMTMAELY